MELFTLYFNKNKLTLQSQEESYDLNAVDSSQLPAEHRSGDFGPQLGPQLGAQNTGLAGVSPNDPWPLSQPDMPQIKNLQVSLNF